MPRAVLPILFCALLASATGCLPGLGDWELVGEQPGDGGDITADAGTRPRGERDLGAECGPTYLALLIGEQASGAGEIRRFSLPSLRPCRETALGRQIGELYGELRSITGMPDGSLRVGISDTILAIDRDGRPMWRTEVEAMLGFVPLELFPLVVGGETYLAIPYWEERSSNAEGFVLMRDDGEVALQVENLDSSLASIASDPRRTDSVIAAERYGEIVSYPISLSTTALTEETVELPMPKMSPQIVTITRTGSEIAIAYRDGASRWTVGAGAPNRYQCESCDEDGYLITVIDPTANRLFSLCDRGSDVHLVSLDLGSSTCTILEDGTFLGTQEMKHLTIVSQ
jgi:hypothetical protein